MKFNLAGCLQKTIKQKAESENSNYLKSSILLKRIHSNPYKNSNGTIHRGRKKKS